MRGRNSYPLPPQWLQRWSKGGGGVEGKTYDRRNIFSPITSSSSCSMHLGRASSSSSSCNVDVAASPHFRETARLFPHIYNAHSYFVCPRLSFPHIDACIKEEEKLDLRVS